jgi:ParB family chromosome partitioning protein
MAASMENKFDTKKRSALGKGLESLLPSRPSAPASAAPAPAVPASPAGRPLEIPLDLIDRNPFQTRTVFDEEALHELAVSIAASGVVQPVLVRPGPKHAEDGRYTLITGERRLIASRKAGKTTIPAVVRELSNVQAMEMTIVENLMRTDLNPMEQAHAFSRLSREFHMTQEQMAERTGKDRASIANFLRLLKLPEIVQQHVANGDISFGHARALLALPTESLIISASMKVLALHLSVRSTENYVAGLLNPEKKSVESKPVAAVDPNVREVQDELRRSLGLRVTIEDKKGKGKVVIDYSNVEEFDVILTALGSAGR